MLDSADDLRVDAIAQELWCAEPASETVEQARTAAAQRGYDTLPIRDARDGHVRKIINRAALNGVERWEDALRRARPLTADLLVARESPVLRLLERLDRRHPLFTLGRDGRVDGIVTIFDLNQPAAHLLAFGMALVCESDLARALLAALGSDPIDAAERAERALGEVTRGIRRWREAKDADSDVHVAFTLSLGEKIDVLKRTGLQPLADAHGVSTQQLLQDLTQIRALRNAVGHYDERKLADHEWTFPRMRTAQRYAQQVSAQVS